MASPFDDVQHFFVISFSVKCNFFTAAEFLITPESKCDDKISQFSHNCFNLKKKAIRLHRPVSISFHRMWRLPMGPGLQRKMQQ